MYVCVNQSINIYLYIYIFGCLCSVCKSNVYTVFIHLLSVLLFLGYFFVFSTCLSYFLFLLRNEQLFKNQFLLLLFD